ncbi:hypothetical protein Tco_0658322 [Tanacetum coccineum]
MVFPRLDPGSTVLVDLGKPCTERKPVKRRDVPMVKVGGMIKGGIVAIVEGEAHCALGLRGGLLGVQTQSHIGKIIISKLTYKLGGLLLLSPIGFRMEPQLGLYVRLSEMLGQRYLIIGLQTNVQGLLAESGYELSLVAGIATGAWVKGGSRSEVLAQVEGAAYRRKSSIDDDGVLDALSFDSSNVDMPWLICAFGMDAIGSNEEGSGFVGSIRLIQGTDTAY